MTTYSEHVLDCISEVLPLCDDACDKINAEYGEMIANYESLRVGPGECAVTVLMTMANKIK